MWNLWLISDVLNWKYYCSILSMFRNNKLMSGQAEGAAPSCYGYTIDCQYCFWCVIAWNTIIRLLKLTTYMYL